MRVAHDAADLPAERRTAVVDDFDGVHVGHRGLLAAARTAAARDRRRAVLAVVIDDPEARELLTTVGRRLELLEAAGADEALVVRSRPSPDLLPALDAIEVHASFALSAAAAGELARAEVAAGHVEEAAAFLGRPAEVEGTVVGGDARGRVLGFPTANLDPAPRLLLPANGIYAGAARGCRAAVSIGTNPHYSGTGRRIEAFLLDFEGDLYGERLLLELWRRLRDERSFASDAELVAQIARDVEAARAASPPSA